MSDPDRRGAASDPDRRGAASDPGAVWRVIHGYTGYWAAVAGVELGLFDALAGGPLDAVALARRSGAPPERVVVIADALVATGLLSRSEGVYSAATGLLGRGVPGSMADLLVWSPGPAGNWPALARTVRGSSPPWPVEDDAASFYAHLVDATFPSQVAVARAVLAALAPPPGARLLELGAGRAPWASVLLADDPTATAVLNDLPEVLVGTVDSLGALAARCTFVPGDYASAGLGDGRFELVVLGHLLRAEPDERAASLVARAASLVAPGGHLVVTEYLGGRDPATHPQPALLAATMLAATRHGRAVTEAQVTAWLASASCEVVAAPDPVANTDILVASPAIPSAFSAGSSAVAASQGGS